MAHDRLRVTPHHRTGQRLGRLPFREVRQGPFDERPQRLPRFRVGESGVPQQALGHGLDHDEIIRREHRARVVHRLVLGREAERLEPHVARELLGGFHRPRHPLHRRPRSLETLRRALGIADRLQRVQGAERGLAGDEWPQRLLALHPREVQHHVLGAHRLAVLQYQGEPAECVVADGEHENANLPDPGGRAIVGAHREGERRGDGRLAPPVEADRIASPSQRQPQADPRPARSDDADGGVWPVGHLVPFQLFEPTRMPQHHRLERH